jgi:ankyrin repeat protein
LPVFHELVNALTEKDLFWEQCLEQETLESRTPLHCVVQWTDIPMAKLLLDNAHDTKMVDMKDNLGETALHLAADRGNVEMVLRL